jgi:hypothetical protein
VGAGIFYVIEFTNEKKQREENNFPKQYKNFTDRYNISEEDMIDFIDKLEKAVNLGYIATKGSDGWPNHFRWQFMNAFHFAGNVVTTIGK